VERPPTVPCTISAPQRGQLPPGWRAAMTSPVCAPPPSAIALPSTERSARYSRSVSLRCRRLTGVAGGILACHKISSASRFPIPAIFD